MFKESLSILAILCLIIVLAEWLNKKDFFKHLGSGLMVIIFGAIAANLGIIPASQPETAIYEGIFNYIAPMSIFLMLLNINLGSLKKAGKPMLMMFLIGSLATMVGVVLAVWLIDGKTRIGEQYYALSGMFTGTYIGGSVNFNAVAMHYGVSKQGNLFSAATVADNIISAIWILATLAIPQILNKKFPRVKTFEKTEIEIEATEMHMTDKEEVRPSDIAFLIFLSLGSIVFSNYLNKIFPQIPTVICLTTMALLLAQIPQINRLKGQRVLGLMGVYLLLTVIGAYCDIGALLKDGKLALILIIFVTLAVLIHGLIIYGIGTWLRQDWDIIFYSLTGQHWRNSHGYGTF